MKAGHIFFLILSVTNFQAYGMLEQQVERTYDTATKETWIERIEAHWVKPISYDLQDYINTAKSTYRHIVDKHTRRSAYYKIEQCIDPYLEEGFALILAAYAGHDPIADQLLKEKRINPRVGSNMPLYMAARNGHLFIVKKLIEAGAPLEMSIWLVAQARFEPRKNEIFTWLLTTYPNRYHEIFGILKKGYDKLSRSEMLTFTHPYGLEYMLETAFPHESIDFHSLFCYASDQACNSKNERDEFRFLVALIERFPDEFLKHAHYRIDPGVGQVRSPRVLHLLTRYWSKYSKEKKAKEAAKRAEMEEVWKKMRSKNDTSIA